MKGDVGVAVSVIAEIETARASRGSFPQVYMIEASMNPFRLVSTTAVSATVVSATVVLAFGLVACRAAIIPPEIRQRGGVGAACTADTACRVGLACQDGACQPSGTLSENQKCDLTAACGPNLYCAPTGVCSTSGAVTEGAACQSSADCTRGLVCALSGIIPLCQQPGTKDVGADCTLPNECLAGLGCNAEGKCASGVPLFTVTPFQGVCGANDQTSFKAYFKVPERGEALPDFFQLPFPNEARNYVSDGVIRTDYFGFPTPPAGPGKALVEGYIDVLANEQDGGFGLNQPIAMRFTQPVDRNKLRYGNDTDPTMFFFKLRHTAAGPIEINPATGCDDNSSTAWTADVVPGNVQWSRNVNGYQCDNSLTFRPLPENPLEPDTYYAMVLIADADPNKSVLSESGNLLTRDGDLGAVLSSTPPSTRAQLIRAHGCYHPLRSALASHPNAPTTKVMAATLFRTQRTVSAVTAMRNTLTAAPAVVTQAVSSIVKCTPGVESPCAIAGDSSRNCPDTASADFDEYHGKMRVPVVQSGTRPYNTEGGFVEYESGSTTQRFPSGTSGEKVKIQGSEEVCFSLAVPKSGADIPVVIYGHGTGGNFRSAISEGLAQRYTTQAAQKMAVLTIEQPMHGPRRGDSPLGPDVLYFNPNNARASRDNAIQAWFDYEVAQATAKRLADVSFLLPGLSAGEALDLRAHFTATPRFAFLGHSQGGINALPFVTSGEIAGAVLSGTGGGLTRTLLGKTAPYNFPVLIGSAIGDAELSIMHPVLGLMQTVADRSDGINYARYFHPPAQATPRHLMHVIGVGDTYTPLATSSDLWSALRSTKTGLPDPNPQPAFQAETNTESGPPYAQFTNGAAERVTALPLLATDLECNCTANGTCGTTNGTLATSYTAASMLYKPTGTADGHFVMFDQPKAAAQVPRFLANVLATGSTCDSTLVPRPTIVTNP